MSPALESHQRWKITLAYDGQPFEGWQSQPSGNTIQDKVEAALQGVTGVYSAVQGSGRTDAGVHAEGQVAHFDAPASLRLQSENWIRALNVHLPPTIRIVACERVPDSFHARYSAESKRYRYDLYIGEIVPPHLHGRVWGLRRPLVEERVTLALESLLGRHDFRCFAANRGKNVRPPLSTVRSIHEAVLERPRGNRVSLHFRGDGFLYKMVRLFVGGLVAFSEGRLSRDQWFSFIEGTASTKAPFCAPAAGLFLVSVGFPRTCDAASPAGPTDS